MRLFDFDDDYEAQELRTARTLQRRYQAQLFRFFDCQDPDHPGCPRCREVDEAADEDNTHCEPQEACGE